MTDAFSDFQEALSDLGITQEDTQIAAKDIIGKIGEEINNKFNLEAEIADIETKLKEKQDLLKELDQVKIPKLLEAAGLSEVTTDSGFKITIKDEYRGNISEANSSIALDWFIKSGGADTIKNKYEIPVSIADRNIAEQLETILDNVGLGYSRKLGIPWNTLAGVIKDLDVKGILENNEIFEELKKEKDLPEDLTLSKVLGVYKYKTTKVQKPKKKK